MKFTPATRKLRQRFFLCAIVALHSTSFAQTPEPPPTASPVPPVAAPAPPPPTFKNTPQVRIDVLMVSLPQDKALALLPDLRDAQKLVAAQAKLLEMIERKEATLIDWPELTTFAGQRGVTENIVEFRYPIEFELPKVPEKSPDLAAAAKPAGANPTPAAEPAKPAVDPKAVPVDPGMVTPTTFEIKNTGTTLEAEAIVSPDGTAATVNLAPQFVTLERMADFPAGKDSAGKTVKISQPIFRVHKVQTNLTLRDGERRLVYVGKPLGPDTTFYFFILGVKVLPAIR